MIFVSVNPWKHTDVIQIILKALRSV